MGGNVRRKAGMQDVTMLAVVKLWQITPDIVTLARGGLHVEASNYRASFSGGGTVIGKWNLQSSYFQLWHSAQH